MHSTSLQVMLVNHVAEYSGHDSHRPYIGLSGIGDCDRVIFDRYRTGSPAGLADKLKCAIGYDLESVLVTKLNTLGVYRPAPEISLYDGLVRGHPDGLLHGPQADPAGELIEIKTLAREEWIPAPPRLPNRTFYQVQAYLHYTPCRLAHVIYLARDTGALQVVGVTQHPTIGRKIEDRLARLVAAVRENRRPACTCGKCVP